MASIRLEKSEKTIDLARLLSLEIGAKVGTLMGEDGYATNIINIEGKDGGDLVIPRWTFDSTMGVGEEEGDKLWRSLVLHRAGEAEVNQNLIVVRNPVEGKRGFLLRFEDLEEKERVRRFADRLGYKSMRAFILEAVREEMKAWEEDWEMMEDGVKVRGGEVEA